MTRFPRYPVWSRGKSLHGWESCFHKNKPDCSTIPSSMGELRALGSSPRGARGGIFPDFPELRFLFDVRIFPYAANFTPFIILLVFYFTFDFLPREAKRSVFFSITRESDLRRILFCMSRIFELRTNEKIFGPYFLLQRFKLGEDRGRGREIWFIS